MTAFTTRTSKGSALTYAELDANFTEIDRRTGTGWNDLVQEVVVRSGANAPTLTQYRNGIYAYEFSPDVMNEVFANFHLRHDYNENGGTTPGMVYPHIHFSSNTTSTGVVRFGCEWTAAQRADAGVPGTTAFGATGTLYFEHTISAGEQYTHHVSEAADGGGIPKGTVLGIDCLILCRFFRDATHINDTYPDPIHLLTVDVHYPTDTASSLNRQYPFF